MEPDLKQMAALVANIVGEEGSDLKLRLLELLGSVRTGQVEEPALLLRAVLKRPEFDSAIADTRSEIAEFVDELISVWLEFVESLDDRTLLDKRSFRVENEAGKEVSIAVYLLDFLKPKSTQAVEYLGHYLKLLPDNSQVSELYEAIASSPMFKSVANGEDLSRTAFPALETLLVEIFEGIVDDYLAVCVAVRCLESWPLVNVNRSSIRKLKGVVVDHFPNLDVQEQDFIRPAIKGMRLPWSFRDRQILGFITSPEVPEMPDIFGSPTTNRNAI